MGLIWLLLLTMQTVPAVQQAQPFTQSPSEHIVNTIGTPFEVRSVEGRIRETIGDRLPLADVTFEVRGPGTGGKVKGTTSDRNGRFRIDHLPEGTYDFKATLNGFQSITGKIIVSKKAPRHDQITIDMDLGV
jgi:hypothetical protein